jgi:predicted metal-dependent hydrolase
MFRLRGPKFLPPKILIGKELLLRLGNRAEFRVVKSLSPEQLVLGDGHATVFWRRSSRARRVSLRIDPTRGLVVVTLPMRAGRAAGMALLNDNADWVTGKLAALPLATALADGATIPIHGVPHIIRHAPDAIGAAFVQDGCLYVTGAPEFLARRAADFLRKEAKRHLAVLALAAAARAGVTLKRVTVKDTRTRWGSCSPDAVLMFCWRLIMAPGFVQEYVVAHEVAHVKHLNHGRAFWALTDQLTQHRTEASAWLHEEGTRLLRVG